MHRAHSRTAAAIIAMLAVACSRGEPGPRPLYVVRSAPALGASEPPLLLNDAITVYFSEPLLPLSITSDSVAMIDERGLQVPGSLRSGPNWVAFVPTPPMSPSLEDGSFRPGARYRLVVAGSPRPDAVRSLAGRRLQETTAFDVRIATPEQAPAGLPAPLRPTVGELPFMLSPAEGLQQLPADAPRLQLHFTRPLLPASVAPASFDVGLLDRSLGSLQPLESLTPRSVRVLTSRLDELPGCTVEIDLGALPRRASGKAAVPLRSGDWISVGLRTGPGAVLDYSGSPPLPATPQCWTVVEGDTATVGVWPDGETRFVAERGLQPCFEVHDGTVRPRVRVEAGDGHLGLLQPKADLVLRPGQPFDRGDGTFVVSDGADFPFLAIDIPRGVTVRVDASGGPVRLRSCADVHVVGSLLLLGSLTALPPRRSHAVAARDLIAAAPVAIVAAGDIHVAGVVRTEADAAAQETSPLLLATAGDLHLSGELPFRTMLAVEEARPGEASRIHGSRGQSVVFATHFQYGLAPGAELAVVGVTRWLQMPIDRDGAVLALVDAAPELQCSWQGAPPESVRREQPDLAVGRVGRLQPIRHGERIAAPPDSFVRLELTARVTAVAPVPTVRELRLLAR